MDLIFLVNLKKVPKGLRFEVQPVNLIWQVCVGQAGEIPLVIFKQVNARSGVDSTL